MDARKYRPGIAHRKFGGPGRYESAELPTGLHRQGGAHARQNSRVAAVGSGLQSAGAWSTTPQANRRGVRFWRRTAATPRVSPAVWREPSRLSRSVFQPPRCSRESLTSHSSVKGMMLSSGATSFNAEAAEHADF